MSNNIELEKQKIKYNKLENENELLFEAVATYSIAYRKAIDCILDVVHRNKAFMIDIFMNANSNEEFALIEICNDYLGEINNQLLDIVASGLKND